MYHTLIIGLIVVFLAWLSRYNKTRYGLEVGFIILTGFLAIRYDWGNDYPAYLQFFQELNSYGIGLFDWAALSLFKEGEIGWTFLNKLFAPVGFFGLVMFLTIFEHAVLYRFIKKYVPANWYWFAVFIYVFYSGFMLTGSSMMRQFLAMCIYIISIDFIVGKRPVYFFLLIILAASFHTSAYILLPTYFVRYLNFEIKPLYLIVIIPAFYFWSIYAADMFGDTAKILMALEDFEKYEVYVGSKTTDALGTGLGVIFANIIAITCLYYSHKLPTNLRLICLLMLLDLIFIPFASIAPLVGRLGMYFSILSIVIYPVIFRNIGDKAFRYFIVCGYMIVTTKGFFEFFYSDLWYERFFEYQTIFSASNLM
ncbi:MAG: EpsG family protein [Muribaculaceae bacterium]